MFHGSLNYKSGGFSSNYSFSTLYNEGQTSEAARYLRMAVTYDPGVKAYLKQCEEEG